MMPCNEASQKKFQRHISETLIEVGILFMSMPQFVEEKVHVIENNLLGWSRAKSRQLPEWV